LLPASVKLGRAILKDDRYSLKENGDDREDRPHHTHGWVLMLGKGCLLRFKPSDLSIELVVASSAEVHGEHLIFLDSDGRLAALCVLDTVESWSVIDLPSD
jgi:hypothetical protein